MNTRERIEAFRRKWAAKDPRPDDYKTSGRRMPFTMWVDTLLWERDRRKAEEQLINAIATEIVEQHDHEDGDES